MKRYIQIIAVVLVCMLLPMDVYAQSIPYDTYNYDYRENAVPTPAAYVPVDTIYGKDLECGSFNTPKDMFIAEDGTIYVADSGNNRIVVMNQEYEILEVLDSFQNNLQEDTFLNPSGICVTDENLLYIADTDHGRVVVLDQNRELVKIISDPKSDVLSADFTFSPLKVSVDYAGRVYVVAANIYQGIMAFDQDSQFMGYFGTINVQITLYERFWRLFSTKEQRSKQQQFIPTEFTNVDIDSEGFVYATNIDTTGEQAVRMLNPKGQDVIVKPISGTSVLGGDVKYRENGQYQGVSEIVDVKVRDGGIYSLLDRKRGRVFSFDSEGNCLYIFGGLGTQEGTFSYPVAIESYGDKIYILDSSRSTVAVFEATQYGKYINEAVGLRYDGDEVAAVELWEKVLELDSNNEMAYSGIGKAYLSAGDNETAMYYLKMGMNREFYSIAFKRYRNDILKDNLGWILTGVIVVSVGYPIAKAVIKRKKRG